MAHFIERCICGIIITQCRCMNKDTELIISPCTHSEPQKSEPKSEASIELSTSAKLVKELISLPKNENSSALVTVDLWKVAELVLQKVAEARIDTLKITHGHQQTGTTLNDEYFIHNITMLERQLKADKE